MVKQKSKSKETPRSGEELVISGTGLDQLPFCGCDKTPCLGNKLKCIIFKFSTTRQIAEVTKAWVSAVIVVCVCVFNKMYINKSKDLDTTL